MFAHSIKSNDRDPVELRSQIDLLVPEDDLKKINQIKPKRYIVPEEEELC